MGRREGEGFGAKGGSRGTRLKGFKRGGEISYPMRARSKEEGEGKGGTDEANLQVAVWVIGWQVADKVA